MVRGHVSCELYLHLLILIDRLLGAPEVVDALVLLGLVSRNSFQAFHVDLVKGIVLARVVHEMVLELLRRHRDEDGSALGLRDPRALCVDPLEVADVLHPLRDRRLQVGKVHDLLGLQDGRMQPQEVLLPLRAALVADSPVGLEALILAEVRDHLIDVAFGVGLEVCVKLVLEGNAVLVQVQLVENIADLLDRDDLGAVGLYSLEDGSPPGVPGDKVVGELLLPHDEALDIPLVLHRLVEILGVDGPRGSITRLVTMAITMAVTCPEIAFEPRHPLIGLVEHVALLRDLVLLLREPGARPFNATWSPRP